MFNDAMKERYIDYNPCSPIRNLKRTDKQARDTIHRALTQEETKAFFEAASKSYYYDVYRMGINTGMRIGEVGALYECDIRNDKIRSSHETIFKSFKRGILLPFSVDRDIARICEKVGIERFTFHAFRATFATRCIEQGVDVRTLQDLLGHEDYKMTMNLYGHVVDDTKTMAMQSIEIAI